MVSMLAKGQSSSGRNFKEKAIKIIKKIPYGRVTTYGTVAILSNFPRGAKFVGGVLHFNSEKFNLPWHRVINRNGFISTRCPEHMKNLQKELLEAEGIEVSKDFMIDLKKYGWFPSCHSERSEESV